MRTGRLWQLTDALLQGDQTARRRIIKVLGMRAKIGRQEKTHAPGATGTAGQRANTRPPRKKRPRRKPSLDTNDPLDAIVAHFDDVYRQLNEQMRLIVKVQHQVRELVAGRR